MTTASICPMAELRGAEVGMASVAGGVGAAVDEDLASPGCDSSVAAASDLAVTAQRGHADPVLALDAWGGPGACPPSSGSPCARPASGAGSCVMSETVLDGIGGARTHLGRPAHLFLDLVEDCALLADHQSGCDGLDGDLAGVLLEVDVGDLRFLRNDLPDAASPPPPGRPEHGSGLMATRRLSPWASCRTISLLDAKASMSLV